MRVKEPFVAGYLALTLVLAVVAVACRPQTGVKVVATKSTPAPGDEITIPLANLPAGGKPLVLRRIPAGSFIMGRYAGEQDSYGDAEDPQHPVTIGYEFYMGKYEITKAQWQAVVGTTPWWGLSEVLNDQDSPAVDVSWNDIKGAGGFLEKMNALGQGTFRLPSEAEWEYACRAVPSGTPTRFYWGDDPNYSEIGNYAWYYDNAANVGELYAHVVGLKLPNVWGLYDMSGNVFGWCEDDWHGNYASITRPDDGSAWIDSPRGGTRVIRGGCFYDPFSAYYCRSAIRYNNSPDNRHSDIGLRIMRTP